jgi:hypothetical protein
MNHRRLSRSQERRFIEKYGMGDPHCKHVWVMDNDLSRPQYKDTRIICAVCGKTEKNLKTWYACGADPAAVDTRMDYDELIKKKPPVLPKIDSCSHVWVYSRPRYTTMPRTRDRVCALCWEEGRVLDGQQYDGNAGYEEVMLALIDRFGL